MKLQKFFKDHLHGSKYTHSHPSNLFRQEMHHDKPHTFNKNQSRRKGIYDTHTHRVDQLSKMTVMEETVSPSPTWTLHKNGQSTCSLKRMNSHKGRLKLPAKHLKLHFVNPRTSWSMWDSIKHQEWAPSPHALPEEPPRRAVHTFGSVVWQCMQYPYLPVCVGNCDLKSSGGLG